MEEVFRAEVLQILVDPVQQAFVALGNSRSDGVGVAQLLNADNVFGASLVDLVNSWESSGSKVASQFIVNKDGSIVQCVPMDAIAHHAGYGDAGHNSEYGVPEDGRDDKKGTTKAPSKSITDYGMNSYSIGIEIVHVGGQGAYPEAQLEAIDGLIAYIDAYYGSESTIIDHKMWRSGNSDTSAEFAAYLANYRDRRTHN